MKTFLCLLLASFSAHAGPLAEAAAGGIQITLHSEKCAQVAVTNLPGRATWTEGGRVSEGCFAIDRNNGLIVLYFDDRTVVAVPLAAFQKVSET